MSLMQRIQRKARRELLTRTAGVRGAAKAAIIGCGQIAPDHLAGVPGVRGRDRGGGERHPRGRDGVGAAALSDVRAFRDYRTMINEMRPDVVSICTWPQHHLEIVRVAAQLGVKGILCEKPMALQMSEVEEMIDDLPGRGGQACDRTPVPVSSLFHSCRADWSRAAPLARSSRCAATSRTRWRTTARICSIRFASCWATGRRSAFRRRSSVRATSRTAAGPSRTARAAN